MGPSPTRHGRIVAATGIVLALMFALLTAPSARAFPSGSCAPVGALVPQAGSYTVCTDDGWKHVFQPMPTNPLGACSNVGTAVPNQDPLQGYQLCTNLGLLYVPRTACIDFPGRFQCNGNIIVTPAARLRTGQVPAATQTGARNPTGPDAIHIVSAVVLTRTAIESPAPGNRAKTRLSPGCTGTLTSGPCVSDSVIEPSLLPR